MTRAPRSRLCVIASVWLALVLMACLSAVSARAQDPEPPEYRQAIDRAISEFAMRNFEEARALFARAHGLLPSARTLRGLAMAEFELRNYGAATQLLEQALASPVRPLEGALRADAQALLAQANDYVARYKIEAQPPPSELAVDGVTVRLPADRMLILQVGDHLLELRAGGYLPERLRLSVNGGEVETLRVSFKKSSGEAAPEHEQNREKALRKSPWLWTAVGLVVAGAATGTALALTRRGDPRGEPFTGSTGVRISGP